MTEITDTGPEIDAETTQAEPATDDGGEASAFTTDGYAALAQEYGVKDRDEGAEPPSDAEPEPDLDTVPARLQAYIQRLRREAAQRRVANEDQAQGIAERDERLAHAKAENDALREWRDEQLRRDVERLAEAQHAMIAPADLWLIAELDDVLTEDERDIDPIKVREVIANRVPPHWLRQMRLLHGDSRPRSGATGLPGGSTTSWSSALGRPAE